MRVHEEDRHCCNFGYQGHTVLFASNINGVPENMRLIPFLHVCDLINMAMVKGINKIQWASNSYSTYLF